MMLRVGSNQGPGTFQVAQRGLEEGVAPCFDLHVHMESHMHLLLAQKEDRVVRS